MSDNETEMLDKIVEIVATARALGFDRTAEELEMVALTHIAEQDALQRLNSPQDDHKIIKMFPEHVPLIRSRLKS